MLDGAVGDTAQRLAPELRRTPFYRPPAFIELGGIEPERRRPVHVVLPPKDNQWHMSYLTAFGALAAEPNANVINYLGLRQDLQFDEFLNIARMTPASPGVKDLAARLNNSDVVPPLYLSLYRLTRHPAASRTYAALDGWLDDTGVWARNESSNIVVVYTAGDVADLCLAWNLRAIHGWGNRLPLAVPHDRVDGPGATAETIATLIDSITNAGMRPRVNLVSESVDKFDLDAILRNLPSARRGKVYDPDQLLVPATPPSRTSATTVVIADGLATIPTRTDHDRHELSRLAQLRLAEPAFELTVAAHGEPVIECPLLRCEHDIVGFRHSGGGPSVDASSDMLQSVRWPSGWTQLAAACRSRGVIASPSQAGHTALALLNAVGDIWQMQWLAHRPLLRFLYNKASSHGMTWWKERADRMAAQVAKSASDAAALEALRAQIAEIAVSQSEATHTFTFSELAATLGKSEPAKAWLDWADARGLVLRGTNLRCPHCTHKQWRPLSALSPPLVCTGCGRSVDGPFPHASMNFAYRLSEPLRGAIENDSIYHLFVARSLLVLLEGGPVPVVGIHPGVDLCQDIHGAEAGQRAEADVLVLFADSSMVPVEVKRNSHQFSDHTLGRLDAAARWLASRAVICATCDSDAQIGDDFLSLRRDHQSPIRRLLTADDWLDPQNVSTMERPLPGPGDVPRDETADEADERFCERLLHRRPAEPVRDPIGERLEPKNGFRHAPP